MVPNVVRLVLVSALSAEAIVNSSSVDGAHAASSADALVNSSLVDSNPIFPFVMPYVQAAAEKTGGLKPGFESKHDFARHCYAFAYTVASDLHESSSEQVLRDKGVPQLCRGADESSCKEFVRDLYGAAQAKKMQRAGYDITNISFTLNKMNASAASYAAWCDKVYAYSLERAKLRVDAAEKAKAILRNPEVLVANSTSNSSVRERRAAARQLKRFLRGSAAANASTAVASQATAVAVAAAPHVLKVEDGQAIEKLRSDIKKLQGVDGAEELLRQKEEKLRNLTEVERNLPSRTTVPSTTAATMAATTTVATSTTTSTTTTTTTTATTTTTVAATMTTTTATTTTAQGFSIKNTVERVVQLNVAKAEAAWASKVAQQKKTTTEAINATVVNVTKHEAANASSPAASGAVEDECVCTTRDGKQVCHCHPKKHHRHYGHQ